MRWRLIALDIDGTLYDRGRYTVDAEDRAALRAAAAAGALVVMVTGRHPRTAFPIWAELGLPPAPAVLLHGAETLDADGRRLRARYLPPAAGRECLRLLAAAGVPARADGAETTWVTGPQPDGWTFPTDVPAPDLHRTLAEPLRQLIVAGTGAVRRALRALGHLDGEVRLLALPSPEEPTVLHVLHPEATKGLALRDLAGRYGIAREEVLAVGDAWPDLPMIACAGLGCVTELAPPGLKAVADRTVAFGPGWLARLLAAE